MLLRHSLNLIISFFVFVFEYIKELYEAQANRIIYLVDTIPDSSIFIDIVSCKLSVVNKQILELTTIKLLTYISHSSHFRSTNNILSPLHFNQETFKPTN